MYKKEIGKNIREYRLRQMLSQEDVAKLLNTTRQCISSWEKDRTQPDYDSIMDLSKVLCCEPSDLLGLSTGEANIEFIESRMNDLDNKALDRLIKYAQYLMSCQKG